MGAWLVQMTYSWQWINVLEALLWVWRSPSNWFGRNEQIFGTIGISGLRETSKSDAENHKRKEWKEREGLDTYLYTQFFKKYSNASQRDKKGLKCDEFRVKPITSREQSFGEIFGTAGPGLRRI